MTCDIALFDLIKESRGLSLVRSVFPREAWDQLKQVFNAKGTNRYVFSVTGAEKSVALEGHSHRIKWGHGITLEENFEVDSETFKSFYIDRDEFLKMGDFLCKNNSRIHCVSQPFTLLFRALVLEGRAVLQEDFNTRK